MEKNEDKKSNLTGKLQLKKSLDWLEKTWTRAHQLAVTFPIVSNLGPIIIFLLLHLSLSQDLAVC